MELRFWDDHTKAFEAALSKCSTKHAPWFILAANHKWFRNLTISGPSPTAPGAVSFVADNRSPTGIRPHSR